jgi:CheY-like chemotaxis protein/predicted alpha/beta hydrolase family esterase
MLKVLFVDDSKPRIALVEKKLRSSGLLNHISFVVSESADAARSELLEPIDFMVLDVLLPKKDNGTPQAKNSLDLLSDLESPAKPFIRPKMIVGLTADIERLTTHQGTFLSAASIVLDGSLNSQDWLDQLVSQVQIHVDAAQKSQRLTKDQILITVHGIRTYGAWQTELAKEVKKYSRSFDFIEVKYEYLDLLYFYFPKSREKRAKEIGARLAALIKQHQGKRISIVAHSFGSVILSRAFEMLPDDCRVNTVIICGSPLSEADSIDHIVDMTDQTINECGTRDTVLLFSKLFVPRLGYAGRVGFYRENTPGFVNRFFKGGHSLYFKKYKHGESFSSKFWTSSLAGQNPTTFIDERSKPFFKDITNVFIRLFTRQSSLISAGLILTCIGAYYALR